MDAGRLLCRSRALSPPPPPPLLLEPLPLLEEPPGPQHVSERAGPTAPAPNTHPTPLPPPPPASPRGRASSSRSQSPPRHAPDHGAPTPPTPGTPSYPRLSGSKDSGRTAEPAPPRHPPAAASAPFPAPASTRVASAAPPAASAASCVPAPSRGPRSPQHPALFLPPAHRSPPPFGAPQLPSLSLYLRCRVPCSEKGILRAFSRRRSTFLGQPIRWGWSLAVRLVLPSGSLGTRPARPLGGMGSGR